MAAGCFTGPAVAAAALVLLCLVWAPVVQSFKCNSASTLSSSVTCHALVDYSSPNTTTLKAIQSLFNVNNLNSLLGANGLPLSTPSTQNVSASHIIKIPFPCLCTNDTGVSNKLPYYTVVPGDGLYHIAAEVFSGLVTYQEIQRANNISNPDLIDVGQKLWIPLPCSCDEVNAERVVHYGHLVAARSTLEGIAQQYGTTSDTLSQLNGLAGPNDLKAGAIIDVPLRACASMVTNNSLDYPLLVPNGTYVLTANNCVTCNCDAAANNWTLQCEPSKIKQSTCPKMQCQGNVTLGIATNSSNSCNGTTCAYTGYSNQTIFTSTASESTCPASKDKSWAASIHGSWKQKLGILTPGQLLVFVYITYLL